MCPIAARRWHSRHHLQQGAADLDNLRRRSSRRVARVRALGVTSPQRCRAYPTCPPSPNRAGFESVGFYGISAPKGTPPEIVDTLNKAIGEALKDPRLVARLAEIGGIPRPMTRLNSQAGCRRDREMAESGELPAFRWIEDEGRCFAPPYCHPRESGDPVAAGFWFSLVIWNTDHRVARVMTTGGVRGWHSRHDFAISRRDSPGLPENSLPSN